MSGALHIPVGIPHLGWLVVVLAMNGAALTLHLRRPRVRRQEATEVSECGTTRPFDTLATALL